MATYHAKDLRELGRLLKRKGVDLDKAFKRATKKAARKHAAHLRRNMPVATSELRDSVVARGSKVIVDAPHAAAVERGSRPHWPPFEPILEWVKLRGFQGLMSAKQMARLPGTSTVQHAQAVASGIRDRMLTDGSDAIAANAPEQIARAIQASIAKHGTKPQWYMRNSLPAAHGFLSEAVTEEIRGLGKSQGPNPNRSAGAKRGWVTRRSRGG